MAAETIRIEIPIEAQDKTNPAVQTAGKNLESLSKSAQKVNSSMGQAEGQVSKFDKQAEKTNKTLQSWLKQKWQLALEAKDKISPVLTKLKSGLGNLFNKGWNLTMKAVDLATAPIRGIINLVKNPIFAAGSMLGITIGLKDTVDTYKAFEAAMSQVQAVSGATGGEMEKLTAKAKEMGATTKFTAEESAQAFNYMAMAGWKSADMINGIEGILNLAAAAGEDLGTTSDIVTDALTAFRLEAKDAGHFADVLAAASSNANTNVSMMGETFKYAGAMSGALGYSIEDVALATGLMANAGIKSTMSGTALNMFMTRLSTNMNGARDKLEALGIQFFDAAGKARPFREVLEGLRKSTAEMNDEEKATLANSLAGTNAQKGLLAILNASQKDYDKLAEAIDNADGASQRMADTMLDNLSGSLTILQSAVDGAKISLGERLAPYIREFAENLTEMMPKVEEGIDSFMDWFDGKVDDFKDKLGEITGSDEFQNADFFGKVHILWDEIIANPFKEWWNGKGKIMFTDIANDVGKGIGTGIKSGILMLLGVDVSGALDDGASVGASFAKGFAEGFDGNLIMDKLKDAIKNMFSSAGKLLPGGEAPDMSSLLSAAILMKVGSPLLSLGRGAFSIGKGLFGTNAATGTSLMGSMIGSTGNAMVQGTGLLNGMANAGYALTGSTALSGGAAALIGGAGILGGVAGGASFLSGAVDWYKGSKSNDAAEKEALQSAGRMKMGGVAGGALAGAAIGSVIPVIGTAAGALIGAGIGGIAGWIGGNKKKKEYEEQVRLAEEAAEAEAKAQAIMASKAALTGRNMSDLKFETKELTDALNDAEVSATDFAYQFQEAVSQKVQDAFGNIVLSAQEIKDISRSIVFDGQVEKVEKFQTAISEAQKSLFTVKGDLTALEKLNWKNGIGLGLSDEDAQSYKDQVDKFISDAQSYLEDKHYEGTLSNRMLLGDDADLSGLDSTYSALNERLERLGTKLAEATSRALEDGVIYNETITLPDGTIQLNEQAELTSLQKQIQGIMNQITQAEDNAKFDALKIKYGGSDLSAGSFQELQEQLASDLEEMSANYDQALEIDLKNLHLQFPNGGAEFDEAFAQIQEAYRQKISEMNLKSEDFQLGTIADAFAEQLDGILPTLEGTTSEKLKQAMDVALSIEPDSAQWTQEQITSMFGLENLSTEAQTAIGTMLQQVASTIPQEAIKNLDESGFSEAQASLKSTLETTFAAAIAEADLGPAYEQMAALNAAIESNAISTIEGSPINATKTINLQYSVNDPGMPQLSLVNTSRLQLSMAANSRSYGGGHAEGGFINGAELSWIGEDGPEAIIPLGAKRRQRGLDLYEQVGRILGINGYAGGGIFPTSFDAHNASISSLLGENGNSPDEGFEIESGGQYGLQNGGGSPIQIKVELSPSFQIESSDTQSEEDIVNVIRRHIKDMADEIGGEIASRLTKVYENMPMKGAT